MGKRSRRRSEDETQERPPAPSGLAAKPLPDPTGRAACRLRAEAERREAQMRELRRQAERAREKADAERAQLQDARARADAAERRAGTAARRPAHPERPAA